MISERSRDNEDWSNSDLIPEINYTLDISLYFV